MAWYKKILEEKKKEIVVSAIISIVITSIFSIWYFIIGKSFEWRSISPISQPSLFHRYFYSAFVFFTIGAFLYYVVKLWKILYFIFVKILNARRLYNLIKGFLWTILILLAYFYIVPTIVDILNAIISFFYNILILFMYLLPLVGVFLLVFLSSYGVYIIFKQKSSSKSIKGFVNSSKKTLQRLQDKGNCDENFLKIYRSWSDGICFNCGKKINITSLEKTGSGLRRRFGCCGCTVDIILLEETRQFEQHPYESYRYSRIGINQGNVQVKIKGDQLKKTSEEISVVKIFCHCFYQNLSVFYKDIDNSPIDIKGESEDGSEVEYFQVTKLDSPSFWQDLKKNGVAKRNSKEIHNLIQKAINRKINFDKNIKHNIILLIDASPGIMKNHANNIKKQLELIFKKSEFKEIWLVGSNCELSYRLFP